MRIKSFLKDLKDNALGQLYDELGTIWYHVSRLGMQSRLRLSFAEGKQTGRRRSFYCCARIDLIWAREKLCPPLIPRLLSSRLSLFRSFDEDPLD